MLTFRKSLPRSLRPWLVMLLGLALALWVTPVAALERRSGDPVNVRAGETIDDDLAVAGGRLTIGGHVTGDVFIAGGEITILPSAQIDGDLIAAGGEILVSGVVGGDARIAGGTLELNGTINRNVTAFGSEITLGPNATVKGNWISGSESVFLQGTIDGNATLGAADVALAGRIGRNAELAVEDLSIQPTARIGGNLTYVSDDPQAVPAGTVQGQTQHVASPKPQREEQRGPDVAGIVFGLILLAGTVIVGLLLAWLAPGFYPAAQTVLERQALLAFAVGLVTLIVTPILAIILMITVLGLPLGILGLVAYFVSMYIGWLAAGTALAGLLVGLVRRQGRPVAVGWLVALGVIGLYSLTRIPFAGFWFAFVVLCLGLGILVILIAERLRRPTPAPAPALGAPAR
jgi:cytoskeletal protein CcmA (bactofilin family)